MNFRLLSDTPIAPAGRRLSGADIFAPPAEVCGTNFPFAPLFSGSAVRVLLIGLSFINILISN